MQQKILRMQQKIKLGLGGAHLPFPGIGHFRSEGTGYVWVPLEYSPYGTNLSSK
jgi:hypothetical protein